MKPVFTDECKIIRGCFMNCNSSNKSKDNCRYKTSISLQILYSCQKTEIWCWVYIICHLIGNTIHFNCNFYFPIRQMLCLLWVWCRKSVFHRRSLQICVHELHTVKLLTHFCSPKTDFPVKFHTFQLDIAKLREPSKFCFNFLLWSKQRRCFCITFAIAWHFS